MVVLCPEYIIYPMGLKSLHLFAGWDYSIVERAMIAGLLLLPVSLIVLVIGAITKKKTALKIGAFLLLLGLLNLFVFLPNL